MSTDRFIDGGKADLLTNALKGLQDDMGPIGIQVVSLSWGGKPEYPPTVIDSINAKVTANQKTLQRAGSEAARRRQTCFVRSRRSG